MSGVGNYQRNNLVNKMTNVKRAMAQKQQYNTMISQLSSQIASLRSQNIQVNARLVNLSRQLNVARRRSSNLNAYIGNRVN
jgi:flagellar biosynthesis chaperone FliJ